MGALNPPYYYHYYDCYYYCMGLLVLLYGSGSQCVRGRELWPVLTVLPHTRHQVTLLPYCPALFALKIPAWSSTTNSSKFTGHVSPIHQYPH